MVTFTSSIDTHLKVSFLPSFLSLYHFLSSVCLQIIFPLRSFVVFFFLLNLRLVHSTFHSRYNAQYIIRLHFLSHFIFKIFFLHQYLHPQTHTRRYMHTWTTLYIYMHTYIHTSLEMCIYVGVSAIYAHALYIYIYNCF